MPGITMHPAASMAWAAAQDSGSPRSPESTAAGEFPSVPGVSPRAPAVLLTAAIIPSLTATSPQYHGLPVPSTTC
ncbi:MAG: hypothetical protein ACM3WU_03150 [Bacillota bacterium]